MLMSKKTAAYLAGLLDGEGYFGIMKEKNPHSKKGYSFNPVVKMASTNKEIVIWLKDSFGGYTETRKARENAKESYAWTLKYRKNLREFILLIRPYSKIKKEAIDVLLKRLSYDQKSKIIANRIGKKQTQGWKEYSEDVWAELEKLYWEIRRINQRGNGFVQLERLSEQSRKACDSPNL